MQGARVRSPIWEDSTCCRATKPVRYNHRVSTPVPANCDRVAPMAAAKESPGIARKTQCSHTLKKKDSSKVSQGVIRKQLQTGRHCLLPKDQRPPASSPRKTQAPDLPRSGSASPCWGGCSAHWGVKGPVGRGCPQGPPQGGCHSRTRRTPVSGSV